MTETTDNTGAWIYRLLEVEGSERVERLSAMTQHEKDAVLLRLLNDCSNHRARDARLTQVTRQLARLGLIKARLVSDWESAAAMACETPASDCDCPGCSLAREVSNACG